MLLSSGRILRNVFNAKARRFFSLKTPVAAGDGGGIRTKNKPTLTLFTKENCQLCEEALEEIREAGLSQKFTLSQVDIEEPENEKWFGLYRYEIPVFYFENKFLSKNRIDLEKLQSKIREFQDSNPLEQ